VPCLDSEGYEAIAYRGARNSYQRAMRDGFEGAPSDTRLAKHRPEIKQRFKKIIALCKATGPVERPAFPRDAQKIRIKKMATRVLDPSVRCEQGDEAATSAAGAFERRFAGRITGSAKTDERLPNADPDERIRFTNDPETCGFGVEVGNALL